MAERKGYEDLFDNFDDGVQAVQVFLAEDVADAFAGDFFLDYVEETVLVEVLFNLDDVRVVEVLQDLDLLVSSHELHLLGSTFDFADPLDAAVAFHDLPDDAGAAIDYFGEVVKLEDVSSVAFYHFVEFQLCVFLARETFMSGEGRLFDDS